MAEWARTNEEAKLRTTSVLRAGGTITVDDTASSRFLRDGWRQVALGAGARFVLVFLDTDPETLRARWARNRDREERPDVTDAVMVEHLASFEPPKADEVAVTVHADAAPLSSASSPSCAPAWPPTPEAPNSSASSAWHPLRAPPTS